MRFGARSSTHGRPSPPGAGWSLPPQRRPHRPSPAVLHHGPTPGVVVIGGWVAHRVADRVRVPIGKDQG